MRATQSEWKRLRRNHIRNLLNSYCQPDTRRINIPARTRSNLLIGDMSEQPKVPPSADELLRNSMLYREFQALKEEVLRHKWIESEKAGKDIGFERARTDWMVKHSSQWWRNR